MLSTLPQQLAALAATHPLVVGWVVTCLVALYRSRTPAQWVALGESNPRLQGLFKAARALGVDPARAIEAGAQVVSGRRVPDPRELVIASQAAQIADLQAALATYQRRVAAQTVVDAPEPALPTPAAPFDASARQTIAPEVVAEAQRLTRDRLPGRAPLGALLAVLALSLLGAGLACGPLTEAGLRATPGVPDPAACVAGTQRCHAADAGAVPEVCSATGRWWSALAPRGDGTARVCPGACAVTDAGVAYCAAADGGGR